MPKNSAEQIIDRPHDAGLRRGGTGTSSSSGATAFLGLTDTPSSYAGATTQLARVNAGETALEFSAVNAADVGVVIHGATAKTTPIDADTMPLIDSAASNVLKKVTWANIKATLKSYLDTLYGALATTNTWALAQTFSAKPIVNADIGIGTGTNSNIVANNDASVLSFVGAITATKGAYVALGGVDHATDVVNGRVEIVVNTRDSTAGGTLNVLSYNGVSTWLTKLHMSRAGLWGFGGVTTPAAAVDVLQATLGDAVLKLASTATNDDPAEIRYQNRVTTTDATVTTLHTFTIAASNTVGLVVRVVARRTGGVAGTAEDGAFYDISCAVKNVAGTATLIGAVTVTAKEDQAGWDATVDVTGATARVRVTGATNNNVVWHMHATVMAVGT